MNLEAWQWAVVLITTFVAALLQGTIGFGYAVLSVPVLSLVDPRLVPVPQILTALPATLFAVGRERSYLDVKGAAWILLGRVPGAALGAGLLAVATRRALDLLIGAIVLSGVLMLATRVKLRRSPMMDFAVGAFATTTGYVSAIGGPPVALLLRDERGPRLRSTLGLVFFVGIVVTLTVRTATGQITWLDVWLGAVLTPAVVLGMLASKWLHGHVEGKLLSRAVLVTSAFAALGLIGRALTAPLHGDAHAQYLEQRRPPIRRPGCVWPALPGPHARGSHVACNMGRAKGVLKYSGIFRSGGTPPARTSGTRAGARASPSVSRPSLKRTPA